MIVRGLMIDFWLNILKLHVCILLMKPLSLLCFRLIEIMARFLF